MITEITQKELEILRDIIHAESLKHDKNAEVPNLGTVLYAILNGTSNDEMLYMDEDDFVDKIRIAQKIEREV